MGSHHDMDNMTTTMMNMLTGNASSMTGHHHHPMPSTTPMDPHAGHNMGGGVAGGSSTSSPMGGHDHHHGTTSDPHAGHDMGDMGHMMKMYFHTGVSEYILFERIHTSNVGGLVGACVAVFALSVVYEGLKYFREFLLRRASQAARQDVYAPSTAPPATTTNGGITTNQPEIGVRMLSESHGVQTLLHMVQVFVSYCLMLVFMTYNVYLCIAIVLGAGLGYFIFGWRRAVVVDMNEHCH